MADELSLQITAAYSKNGVSFTKTYNPLVTISGNYPIANVQNIGTSDETLALGDITTPGYIVLKNQASAVNLTTQAAPSVTNQGTAGTTTDTYKIVAKQTNGAYSAASAATTTTTAAATLTGANFNRLTWVAQSGADAGYDIYRTAAAGTPSTTGKIGSVGAGVVTFDDTGLAGDGGTAPATGIDNVVLLGSNGTSYPAQLKGGEVSMLRWNGSAIHAKGNTAACDLEYMLLPD